MQCTKETDNEETKQKQIGHPLKLTEFDNYLPQATRKKLWAFTSLQLN